MVSFDSDYSGGDGASLFFSEVSLLFFSLPFCLGRLLRARGGSEKDFSFGDSANLWGCGPCSQGL